ncbi:MAG: M14 family metallopeptidase [Phycisphaerales bacterium]
MNHTPAHRLALAALLAASSALAQVGPFEGHRVVRVSPRTPSELLAVSTIATNVWSCRTGLGPIDVQVTLQQQAALEQLGLSCEVRIENVQTLIDAEQAQIRAARLDRDASWFTTYKTLSEINAKLDELAATSDGLASTFVVGNSLEGRQVKGIRFTGPATPGNPRDSRPAAVYAGGIHAREWVSPMTTMYIADRMIEMYAAEPRIAELLEDVEIIVIPVQNVDGYEFTWANTNNRLWRKNRRPNANGTTGVDLNRNFGFGWGGEGASTDPGSDIYRGTSAFSEPETQIFRDFVIANPRLRAHIDFHSFSQLVLTPYGYTIDLPPDADLFADIGADMVSALTGVHGMTYVAGPTYTTIYPASGGAHDWSYGERNILGMTIELRDRGQTGFVLPADQILPTAEENFEAVFVLADTIRKPLLLSTPDDAIGSVAEGSTFAARVRIRPGTSTLAPGGASIHWRHGSSGSFNALPMTGVDTLSATLTGAVCGEQTQWYFEALAADGSVARLPEGAPATTFVALTLGSSTIFSDTMETDRGWSVGAPGDNATAGTWQRADPVGTAAQPEDDASEVGTICWVTGASGGAVGANDVDGGTTTLTSPLIDASGPRGFVVTGAELRCSIWYSNNAGASPNLDSMPVEISRDDGASWAQVALVSENRAAWWTLSVPFGETAPPTATTRVRFRARDLAPGSIVEAGVDDVRIVLHGCRTADFNGDSGIDGDDVIDYFAAWDSSHPHADYTGDGGVDGDDVIRFFALWDANR